MAQCVQRYGKPVGFSEAGPKSPFGTLIFVAGPYQLIVFLSNNVEVGARILEADYARATRRYGPGQVALGHALSAYNSGGFFAGLAYARGVYATAARLQAGHTP